MSLSGFSGFSRALYSNWLWAQPYRLIVDAGEGLALALATSVFSVDVIALTHGHSDHLLGLPGLAGARRFGKGAPEKPYTVVYPRGASGVDAIRDAIANLWRDVDFPITWTALAPGESHRLSAKRQLQGFAVTHVPPEPAMGYRVIELRRRLKPEFAELPQSEVELRARQHGRDDVMEEYAHPLFVHSGDAMPIDIAQAAHADVLMHDATFLEPDDRRAPIHASSREVFALARQAGVKTLILHHLSIRYDRPTALLRLREQMTDSGFAGDAWLLDEATFINLR